MQTDVNSKRNFVVYARARRAALALAVLGSGVGFGSGCSLTTREDDVPPPRTPVRYAQKPKPPGHQWEKRENLVCAEFCSRLASCWYAVPHADQTLTREAVITECRREESNCQAPTRDTHCCGWLSNCKDFVSCQANSRGVPSDCQLAASQYSELPPTFEEVRRP
jgi:hypothetical protein